MNLVLHEKNSRPFATTHLSISETFFDLQIIQLQGGIMN